MAAAADVHAALRELGLQLTEYSPLQAIKCYSAMLGLSLLPDDEARARLSLGTLLLEHTHNAGDAKAHLQKADLLARPLPGQALLRCEILSRLAAAHAALGESSYAQQCWARGTEVCCSELQAGEAQAGSSCRRSLAGWGVACLLHSAQAHVCQCELDTAAQHAQRAGELAAEHGLEEMQLLCQLFQLQLALMNWSRPDAERLAAAAAAALQSLEQRPGDTAQAALLARLRLHLTVLQTCLALRLGNMQQLLGDGGGSAAGGGGTSGAASVPAIVGRLQQQLTAMKRLDEQVAAAADRQQQAHAAGQPIDGCCYSWLPPACLEALVELLCAAATKPSGRVKPALEHVDRGLALLEPVMTAAASRAAGGQQSKPWGATSTAAVALHLLLLETRCQLHLLSGALAAARDDVCAAVEAADSQPGVLSEGLVPSLHVLAGLYAQAMGASDAAHAHFVAATRGGDTHVAGSARCLAALAALAADTPASVGEARELLTPLLAAPDGELGYAERAAAQVGAGLLCLSAREPSEAERGDAKQHLSRALKLAHGRLSNHQLVTQVLLAMAPLQGWAGDADGALQMVTSAVTLAKASGDLAATVAGVAMLQQVYHASRQPSRAAQNLGYLTRKQEELSGCMQDAETGNGGAAAHARVLAWRLGAAS